MELERGEYAPAHPVDKGWAWAILSASLGAMMIYGGIHRGFGILFVEFRKTFNSSSANMSVVVSIQIAVMSLSGLFLMTVGMKYFSSRQCVILGGFCVTTSLILSTFAQSVVHLIFTHSVLVGIGLAAMMGPSLILTGQYFDVRRGMANGFHTAAASFGAFVFSPGISYFIHTFHLKGALLILAGLAFHVVPAGMLLRPPELYEKWARRRRLKNSNNIKAAKTALLIAGPDKDLPQKGTLRLNEYRPSSIHTSATLIPSMKQKDTMSVHSYEIPKYSKGVPVVITVVYLPDVAKDCGIPSDEAALLVSIYMVGEIIGRCGSGLFSGKLIHRQIVIAWALLIAGIAQNLVRFLLTFWLLAVFAFINGVFGGPIHGLYASVVADILGIQNLRSGLCVLQMSQGVIWSVILPITGYLRDVSGDYLLTYHFVGSITISASIILFVSHYKLNYKSQNVDEFDVEEESA
ncbi:monocarboxylate transporter 13-like isoform X3 [Ostrea edulis]|uniref:monocarboxylate transporter 13-like isoform X3 n=1 Tax=Ostrea edulis TaxID=37623 RepID=UPI0024AF5040|nr:monocarboxylate transporter 13-like isoform X3 [Ostrea edulis]